MRRAVATLVALAALGAAAPADASTPLPWCGTAPAQADVVPDADPGFAVHVAYVRPAGAPDRLRELAPRIVGDVTAIDAWWRSQDPGRTVRFDLLPIACPTAFGSLDITSVELAGGVAGIGTAFSALRFGLARRAGFVDSDKAYLVYYDGPTGQQGPDRVCGQGAAPGRTTGLPGIAVVYVDSCGSDTSDVTRPVIAVHELIHVLGAVDDEAANSCDDGHVCDVASDLMAPSLSGAGLETHVLDAGRDDYYGHAGPWTDIRESLFLEQLDSPDRVAPTTPTAVLARENAGGRVVLSWRAATDDVGPVSYRLYRDGIFLGRTNKLSAVLSPVDGATTSYAVRALDSVGHLSPYARIRFDPAAGVVDEQGRLLRDTVAPSPVARVTVRRTRTAVVLSWPRAFDRGGVRGYRVKIGARSVVVVKPTLTLAKARVRTAISISAVDRAGNVGPAVVVPLQRLR